MKSPFTCVLLIGLLLMSGQAQDTPQKPQQTAAAEPAPGAAATAVTNAPSTAPQSEAAAETNLLAATQAATATVADKGAAQTNQDSQTKTNKAPATDEIQVSFQGANIDMIVQWLAQTTGKSVVKHPRSNAK